MNSSHLTNGYQEAVDYLYSHVDFEHKRLDQYAPENITLERPARLLSLLDNPHENFPAVHIAGTKGKGSVAAMCAACFKESGLSVGLYTSPHLRDFRDRIRILGPGDSDGRIPKSKVVELVELLKPAAAYVPGVTWYELVTALAFLHFSRELVDVAVVEVGLGGRLDATNLLDPLIAVITSLSLDHTYLLGDSLVDIAGEKGGIIKPDVPLITASQPPEALNKLVEICQEKKAPISVIGKDWDYQAIRSRLTDDQQLEYWKQQIVITKSPENTIIRPGERFSLALAGQHQQENAVVALATMSGVASHFPQITVESIRRGLATVEWPGRLQILSHGKGKPTVLVDCAHNVDSAEKLANALGTDYQYDKLWLILGITVDKDITGILEILMPLTDRVYLTASTHPRAASPQELLQLATELGYESRASESVSDAFDDAWHDASPSDLICITGSIFVVADLLNHWDGLQSGVSVTGNQEGLTHQSF